MVVKVSLRNVSNFALRDVSVDFLPGEASIVVGPNGSGKTTLLKVIAGLAHHNGDVYFNENRVNSLPAYKRNVLYVPQKSALFMHMKVWDNVAFCLKVRKIDNDAAAEKVRWIMRRLSIEHLSSRYPSQLSGGEAKRVAIARALVCNGNPLLLDEMESNLDYNIRVSISEEALKLAKELGLTLVMVTHDLDWAFRKADKIVYLWSGRISYSGPPGLLDPLSIEPEALAWLGSVLRAEVFINDDVSYALINGFKVPLNQVFTNEAMSASKVYISSRDALVDEHGKIEGKVLRKVIIHGVERVIVDIGDGVIVAKNTSMSINVGDKVRIKVLNAVPLKT
uniref:Molybdate/tungstate import ATP-binding protein WtpC n=1 Tax=Fervidicoccus fontis TaxID=683846 RepID=A0A7C1E314_9CREN